MTDIKNNFRIATGKQLIKAVTGALKSKELTRNENITCQVGAWGDDFPHLHFDIKMPNDVTARFNIEMSDDYTDYGKQSLMVGGYCRTRILPYVGVISIDFSKQGWALKTADAKDIKDIDLLNKQLKDIFDGLYVMDYEDDYGSYETTEYSLKPKVKPKK